MLSPVVVAPTRRTRPHSHTSCYLKIHRKHASIISCWETAAFCLTTLQAAGPVSPGWAFSITQIKCKLCSNMVPCSSTWCTNNKKQPMLNKQTKWSKQVRRLMLPDEIKIRHPAGRGKHLQWWRSRYWQISRGHVQTPHKKCQPRKPRGDNDKGLNRRKASFRLKYKIHRNRVSLLKSLIVKKSGRIKLRKKLKKPTGQQWDHRPNGRLKRTK